MPITGHVQIEGMGGETSRHLLLTCRVHFSRFSKYLKKYLKQALQEHQQIEASTIFSGCLVKDGMKVFKQSSSRNPISQIIFSLKIKRHIILAHNAVESNTHKLKTTQEWLDSNKQADI